MPIFQKHDKKVLFLHIPKTAGSSINHLFTDAGWQPSLEGYIGHHPYYADKKEGSLTHLSYDDITEYYNLDQFDFIFSIVRHPCARAVSEYNWQKQEQDFNSWFSACIQERDDLYPRKYQDNHFINQTNYIGKKTDKLYKLEQGFEKIASDIELYIEDKLPRKDYVVNNSTQNITVDDIDKSLVYNIYKEDFERFGYDLTN